MPAPVQAAKPKQGKLVRFPVSVPRPRRPLEMTEHRFQTPGPIELVVKIPTGDIDIETIEGDESLVSLDGDDKLVDLTEVRSGRRRISSSEGQEGVRDHDLDRRLQLRQRALRMRAQVPHGSSTILSTAAADMKIRGRLRRSRRIRVGRPRRQRRDRARRDVKTVSGDVRLDRVGGELRVQTSRVTSAPTPSAARSKRSRCPATCASSPCAKGTSRTERLGRHRDRRRSRNEPRCRRGLRLGRLASEVPLGSDPDAVGGDGPRSSCAARPSAATSASSAAVAMRELLARKDSGSCSRASRSRCSATG